MMALFRVKLIPWQACLKNKSSRKSILAIAGKIGVIHNFAPTPLNGFERVNMEHKIKCNPLVCSLRDL